VSLPTFFGATAFTQQPNYENIAERVGLLNDKSEDQLKKSHLDSAWLYAEEAFGLSKENELIPAQTEAAINMGNVLLRNGDTDSARVCFELALNLSESVKYTKGIGNAYSSLGGMYAGISEYDTAM